MPTANPDTITMRGPQAPTPGAASPAAAAVDPTASIPAGRQRIAEVAAITPTPIPHPPSPNPHPPSPNPHPHPPPPLRITIGRIDVRDGATAGRQHTA
ncbi:MAG: hypothetical protein HZY76_02805 [Anaerolineae bacterium]|nr:MAG: hypothetical protein HZY76_02805 [Anaerolineae bacterium]